MKYLPMSTLKGNAVWSSIAMLAYNLGLLLKQMVLDMDPLSMWIQTVRYRFYQVPAKLVRHGGKLVVKLFCSKKRFAVSGRHWPDSLLRKWEWAFCKGGDRERSRLHFQGLRETCGCFQVTCVVLWSFSMPEFAFRGKI